MENQRDTALEANTQSENISLTVATPQNLAVPHRHMTPPHPRPVLIRDVLRHGEDIELIRLNGYLYHLDDVALQDLTNRLN